MLGVCRCWLSLLIFVFFWKLVMYFEFMSMMQLCLLICVMDRDWRRVCFRFPIVGVGVINICISYCSWNCLVAVSIDSGAFILVGTMRVICLADFGLQCWIIVLVCWALHVLDSLCSVWTLALVMACLGVLLCVCSSIFVGHVASVFVQTITSHADTSLKG